jgi:hypothetical protein
MIDHLIQPKALLQTKKSAGPLFGMGKKLQLVLKNSVFDHVPVHGVFEYILQHPSREQVHYTPQSDMLEGISFDEVQWCMDRLMQGLREGKDRETFIATLENDVADRLESSMQLLEQNIPDAYFARLDSTILRCALRFFRKNGGRKPRAGGTEGPENDAACGETNVESIHCRLLGC